MTSEERKRRLEASQADQRWQRSLARWSTLKPFSRVFHLAAHLIAKAKAEGKDLDGTTAARLAQSHLESGPLFEAVEHGS